MVEKAYKVQPCPVSFPDQLKPFNLSAPCRQRRTVYAPVAQQRVLFGQKLLLGSVHNNSSFLGVLPDDTSRQNKSPACRLLASPQPPYIVATWSASNARPTAKTIPAATAELHRPRELTKCSVTGTESRASGPLTIQVLFNAPYSSCACCSNFPLSHFLSAGAN